MTWSYGDWHEDMVALYDDGTDQMVCWLQKKGGVDTKALTLIKAAPELLTSLRAAVESIRDAMHYEDYAECASAMAGTAWFETATKAIALAEGRGE